MRNFTFSAAAAALALTLATGGQIVGAAFTAPAYAQTAQQAGNLSMPELQALVSPIALYPDSLLSQMLMAATYPLEVAEAANWLRSNNHMSSTALQNALKPQTWDNSVKSLVTFPDALNMLGNKLDWTQKLGDAYLAQPKDLMQAVQALRLKAKQAGNLKTTQQLMVSTDTETNIIIMPANPQMVYVPTYNPTMVYGAWGYPAYPPYPVYNPAWGFMAFGVGMAVGASLWAEPHWGSGSITVNNANFNNFNGRYNSVANQAANHAGADSTWAHDVAHRDGVPYSSAALNSRYGVDNHSDIDRQSIARQQNAANDWKSNASPEDKQRADQARQNANSDFQRNATAQEKQQASSLNSQARSDASQDRANPNASREASQERQLGSQSRSDVSQDRSSGGGRSFGGGHVGGFRR
ncbi:MAG: DUF3300 domain-containing protein [Alcaligenaceae bacterium]|nr:DUF3300 domain-containing protein [Alcaligenaceae bacterium]